MWMIEHEGERYLLPMGAGVFESEIGGRFPNEPMLAMDEAAFSRRFGEWAIWGQEGIGPFAVLAFCGGELTITRWDTLDAAVKAKRAIDGCGCGGQCAKVHVIVTVDADNPRQAKEKEAIRAYIEKHNLTPLERKQRSKP
jgi:hypothetical protein